MLVGPTIKKGRRATQIGDQVLSFPEPNFRPKVERATLVLRPSDPSNTSYLKIPFLFLEFTVPLFGWFP